MTDWYNEDADWTYDGDVNDDTLYPIDLYWPPVGDGNGITGCGEAGVFALI